jgi:hypothetical protein
MIIDGHHETCRMLIILTTYITQEEEHYEKNDRENTSTVAVFHAYQRQPHSNGAGRRKTE